NLKGGCIHHDNGPLGAAAIDRAEERKIEILKKAGYNAIRCSHNPPSPYLLDVCDRLGILVIDEASDMEEQSTMALAADISGAGQEARVDCGTFMGGSTTWEMRAPHMAMLDAVGYNYAYTLYEEDHKKHPERIMYASEFMPPLTLENWQKVEDLPYVIGAFKWT